MKVRGIAPGTEGNETMKKNKKKNMNAEMITLPKKKKGHLLRKMLRQWQLHLLILLPVIYMLIFHYWPMYGAQIAFRDYRPRAGILGSEWVGMKWFIKFVTSVKFQTVFTNTLILSLYSILASFPLPVLFALILNALPGKHLKKFTQTITYMPHFISIVVLVSIIDVIFSPIVGIYGNVFRLFGGEGYPFDIRPLASSFRHLYVWSGIWQNLGWNTIIYTAALASVSQDQHEAAKIDGASRWQRILHVDLPAIMPTVGIMLILRCGHVMTIGFEKVYLMQSTINLATSEIISTYVYKTGMGSSRDMSYAAAIGLFNSIINVIILVTVNWISRRVSHKEVSLF